MNAANPREQPEIRNRQHLQTAGLKIIEPTRFRSWKDQAAPPTALIESEEPKAPTRKRRYEYSFWRSDDFKIMVALALTALIAAAVYYKMKG